MTTYYCSKCGITWRGSSGWRRTPAGSLLCTACARADRDRDPDEVNYLISTSGVPHPEYVKGHISLTSGGQPGTGRRAR